MSVRASLSPLWTSVLVAGLVTAILGPLNAPLFSDAADDCGGAPAAAQAFLNAVKREADPCATPNDCVSDTAHHYVIVHDIGTPPPPDHDKRASYLIVPAFPVSGIESTLTVYPSSTPDATELQHRTDVGALWGFAWEHAPSLPDVLGSSQPSRWLGLAINSKCGRTVAQMHIHIACVSTNAMTSLQPALTQAFVRPWEWTPTKVAPTNAPAGQYYQVLAMRSPGADAASNPFYLANKRLAGTDIADHSIALIGPQGGDTVYLLAVSAHGSSAENDFLVEGETPDLCYAPMPK